MIVAFRPEAEQELVGALQWYLENGGVAVAERFEHAVHRTLQLLALMPRLGHPGWSGTRLWPLKHFPYTVVYRVKAEVLSIVAVAHQSRAPGYWRGR